METGKISSGKQKKNSHAFGQAEALREQGEHLFSSVHGSPGTRKELKLYQESSYVAYTFLYFYLCLSPVSLLILTGAI